MREAIRKIISTMRNIVKIGTILSVDDSKDVPIGRIKFLGKSGQPINLFLPYGLMSNPPANSLGLLLTLRGIEAQQVCFPADPKTRPLKNLSPGEVAIGNHEVGTYIHFKANGDIIINSSTVEIGSGTTKTVILSTAKDIYNFHTHPAPGGTTNIPNQQWSASEVSINTKVS